MIFDHARLTRQLQKTGRHQKLLFSLLCSERLLAGYQQFEVDAEWGDYTLLEMCVDLGYAVVAGGDNPTDIEELIDRCDAVTPDSEEFQGPLVGHAQNCAISVAYSLDVLKSGKAEDAAYSAQKVIETIDSYLGRSLGLGNGRFDFSDQHLIDSHELMQRELEKHQADLAKIANLSVPDSALVELMRNENRDYVIPFRS